MGETRQAFLLIVAVKSVEQEYQDRRRSLIDKLQRERHILSDRTADAMLAVPRERFLPTHLGQRAYDDEPIPIGSEQTISAPHMVAIMSEALDARPGMKVLEVGTGSGYQAAVLSKLVGPSGHVVSIERIPSLADGARRTLRELGADNVDVRLSDGSLGFASAAPYDRIIVTASAPDVPPPLLAQLSLDGILLVPVGGRECELLRIRKTTTGFTRESLGACAFVPLLGAHGQEPGRVAT